MSLLSIIQAAADETNSLRPSSVIGNTEPDVQKFLRYANKVGLQIMRGSGWLKGAVFPILRKEKTFTASSGTTQSAVIPSDFNRFVPETFWDRSSEELVIGPVGAVEWQSLQARSYNGNHKRFIWRGGSDIEVIPGFGGTESCAFEYVSKNWCESSGGTGQTAWAADTDVGVIDEEILTLGVIFEYLSGEGQPAETAFTEYRDAVTAQLSNDKAAVGVMAAGDIFSTTGRHFGGAPAVSFEELS